MVYNLYIAQKILQMLHWKYKNQVQNTAKKIKTLKSLLKHLYK